MIFGRYGKGIHKTNPTNTATPRTLGVIYIRALDKLQGGFEVINLLTGNIISFCRVIPIPITQEGIDRVESLSKKYGIQYLLKLKVRKEVTISKDDDDENDNGNGSMAGVDSESEEEYEPTIEDYLKYNEVIER